MFHNCVLQVLPVFFSIHLSSHGQTPRTCAATISLKSLEFMVVVDEYIQQRKETKMSNEGEKEKKVSGAKLVF